jgi:hypothetical protein
VCDEDEGPSEPRNHLALERREIADLDRQIGSPCTEEPALLLVVGEADQRPEAGPAHVSQFAAAEAFIERELQAGGVAAAIEGRARDGVGGQKVLIIRDR